MSRSNPTALAPLARALAAARRAEEARLAAVTARVAALREQARALTASAAEAPLPATPAAGASAFDLIADTAWRDRQRQRAADCLAEAARIAAEAQPLRHALARLLGRERALERMIDAAAAERRHRSERTAEVAQAGLRGYSRRSSGRSASGSGASSDGIA